MSMDDLPELWDTTFDIEELMDLAEITEFLHMNPATVRSYVTGRRRYNKCLMPHPACRIANRKLWTRESIDFWTFSARVNFIGGSRKKPPR